MVVVGLWAVVVGYALGAVPGRWRVVEHLTSLHTDVLEENFLPEPNVTVTWDDSACPTILIPGDFIVCGNLFVKGRLQVVASANLSSFERIDPETQEILQANIPKFSLQRCSKPAFVFKGDVDTQCPVRGNLVIPSSGLIVSGSLTVIGSVIASSAVFDGGAHVAIHVAEKLGFTEQMVERRIKLKNAAAAFSKGGAAKFADKPKPTSEVSRRVGASDVRQFKGRRDLESLRQLPRSRPGHRRLSAKCFSTDDALVIPKGILLVKNRSAFLAYGNVRATMVGLDGASVFVLKCGTLKTLDPINLNGNLAVLGASEFYNTDMEIGVETARLVASEASTVKTEGRILASQFVRVSGASELICTQLNAENLAVSAHARLDVDSLLVGQALAILLNAMVKVSSSSSTGSLHMLRRGALQTDALLIRDDFTLGGGSTAHAASVRIGGDLELAHGARLEAGSLFVSQNGRVVDESSLTAQELKLGCTLFVGTNSDCTVSAAHIRDEDVYKVAAGSAGPLPSSPSEFAAGNASEPQTPRDLLLDLPLCNPGSVALIMEAGRMSAKTLHMGGRKTFKFVKGDEPSEVETPKSAASAEQDRLDGGSQAFRRWNGEEGDLSEGVETRSAEQYEFKEISQGSITVALSDSTLSVSCLVVDPTVRSRGFLLREGSLLALPSTPQCPQKRVEMTLVVAEDGSVFEGSSSALYLQRLELYTRSRFSFRESKLGLSEAEARTRSSIDISDSHLELNSQLDLHDSSQVHLRKTALETGRRFQRVMLSTGSAFNVEGGVIDMRGGDLICQDESQASLKSDVTLSDMKVTSETKSDITVESSGHVKNVSLSRTPDANIQIPPHWANSEEVEWLKHLLLVPPLDAVELERFVRADFKSQLSADQRVRSERAQKFWSALSQHVAHAFASTDEDETGGDRRETGGDRRETGGDGREKGGDGTSRWEKELAQRQEVNELKEQLVTRTLKRRNKREFPRPRNY